MLYAPTTMRVFGCFFRYLRAVLTTKSITSSWGGNLQITRFSKVIIIEQMLKLQDCRPTCTWDYNMLCPGKANLCGLSGGVDAVA